MIVRQTPYKSSKLCALVLLLSDLFSQCSAQVCRHLFRLVVVQLFARAPPKHPPALHLVKVDVAFASSIPPSFLVPWNKMEVHMRNNLRRALTVVLYNVPILNAGDLA